MTQTYERTVYIPKKYSNEPTAYAAYNQTYVGFVKANNDAISMGRLQVWIPELSTNSSIGLFNVNYCSPFAGATPLSSIKNDDKENSQTAYGWWAVPPDIDNEVIVQFINGDPNRGIWIGCLYQQYMNEMVPGIPNQLTTTSNGKGSEPTQEYNKKDQTESVKDAPLRPPYKPLSTGLTNQGLTGDEVRGPSTSSARRGNTPSVLGLLSPGGSQFVMDDNPENKFIRFRTAGGTQILVNDTIGMIYMISKNGNSWVEISDEGIDMYSTRSISMRSQGDINFHADKSINMFGEKGIKAASPSEITLQGTGAVNIVSGGLLNLTSQNSLSLKSNEDVSISSACSIGLKASCNVALTANGCLGLTSTCDMYFKGEHIFTNSTEGPTAGEAGEGTIAPIVTRSDRELNVSKNYPRLNTKTIVSRMPTHEPWSGHPNSESSPTQRAGSPGSSTSINNVPSGVGTNGSGSSKTSNNQSTGTNITTHAAHPDGAAAKAADNLLAHKGEGSSQINSYLHENGVNLNANNSAWCAASVNASLASAGIQGLTGNGAMVASNFAGWGTGVDPNAADKGDVMVRLNNHQIGETGGHVGMFTGTTREVNGQTQYQMIQGNYSNKVSLTWENASDIKFRRASTGGTSS